ncbi:MAG: HAD family hydrolase [Candidatus Aminicenantia bacterium]
MRLKGLIFDLDGTIINSYSMTLEYLGYVLKKYGNIELSPEEISQLFGPSEKMIFQKLINPEEVEACYQEYFNLFADHIEKINLFDGFPEILNFLHYDQKKLAIFTGRGRELTKFILEKKQIIDYFETIVTSEAVPNYKPKPDGVLKTCSLLNIPPSKVLHIGDSSLGILSGKNAGAVTGAALWGTLNRQKLIETDPDYLFPHPEEIKKVI